MSADVSRNHACTNQRNGGVNRGFTNIFQQEGNWRGKRFELNLIFFFLNSSIWSNQVGKTVMTFNKNPELHSIFVPALD